MWWLARCVLVIGRLTRTRPGHSIEAAKGGQEDRGLKGWSTEGTLVNENGSTTGINKKRLDRWLVPDHR